jgi:hypothetical protein
MYTPSISLHKYALNNATPLGRYALSKRVGESEICTGFLHADNDLIVDQQN